MRYPSSIDWQLLASRGFDVVVRLADGPTYEPDPLSSNAFVLQDLYGGIEPTDPDRQLKLVAAAADAVVGHLRKGNGVAVHCHGGTGRTGTVIGAALVILGHDVDDVCEWLHDVHIARGRGGWPESEWQRTALGKFRAT